MMPQINGKDLMSCTEDDLKILLDNPDYKENEYIDYKETFSFLEMKKGKERNEKKTEFKCDVCAFANTDGGYILYGISEEKGCVSSIKGLSITEDNTDKFELDRRNDLNGIQPKIPQIQFHFIQIESGKYVVVLYIKHDSFAPYVYIEDEKNYKIYKRIGNGKKMMTYTELREMFNQSYSLEQMIYKFRRERIQYYMSISESFGKSFAHICFIPETFCDRSYNRNIYIFEKTKNIKFAPIFNAFHCGTVSIPCVDGLRYIPYSNDYMHAECYVRNNSIVEACLSLDENLSRRKTDSNEGFLSWGWLWGILRSLCEQYIHIFKDINTGERIFLCISIIGCRNVITDRNEFEYDYIGKIDRDEIIIDPVQIVKLDDSEEVEFILKELYISYLLSIGVKHDKKLKQLIEDVYGVQ